MIERDLKNAKAIRIDLVNEAMELRQLCQFEAATRKLNSIAPDLRTPYLERLIVECNEFEGFRKEAINSIDEANTIEKIGFAINKVDYYLEVLRNASLEDETIESKLMTLYSKKNENGNTVIPLVRYTRYYILCSFVIVVSVPLIIKYTAIFEPVQIKTESVVSDNLKDNSSKLASQITEGNNSVQAIEQTSVTQDTIVPIKVLSGFRELSVGSKAGDREVVKLYNIEIPFRWCMPGDFLMGSQDQHHLNENPVQVKLTRGFWIMETEVTQELYQAVIGSNPSELKGEKKLPVENVSWDDADEFCKRLNRQLEGNFRVTLPSEAQWEYACRAGTTTKTAFGDSLGSDQANFDGSRPLGNANAGPSINSTTSVSKYRSNEWGIYDMHGNVWEWCLDWYDDNLQAGNDPTGVNNGVHRVIRGGSWYDNAVECRSANRGKRYPSYRNAISGFRIVLIPTELKN